LCHSLLQHTILSTSTAMLPGHAQPPARLLFCHSFVPTLPGSRCIFCLPLLVILNGSEGTNKKYTPCQPTHKQKHAPKKEAANLRLHNACYRFAFAFFLHLIIAAAPMQKNPITALCKAGATSQRHTHASPSGMLCMNLIMPLTPFSQGHRYRQ